MQIIKEAFTIRSRRQLRELYLFLLFFSFAAALVTIFEPIFFYTQGISISRIALYYGLHYTLYILLMPLGGKFAARFGFERSLALASPLLAVHFLVLAGMERTPDLFWLAIVTLTVHKIFFWPAFHANFATYSDKHNRGTEQSWVRLILFSTGVIGPLIGGFVIGNYGFTALFMIAAGTLLIAVAPLLRTRDQQHIAQVTYAKVWQNIISPSRRRLLVGMVGWGEDLVYLVFWPLSLFVILGSTEQLGIVVAISVFIMIFWGFIIGELTDRYTARRVLRYTAPAVALANILRIFPVTPLQAFGTELYGRLSGVSVDIPFTARLYKSAKGAGPLTYAIAFETILCIAKGGAAFLFAILFAVLSVKTGFTATFIIAALLSLFYMAI